MRIPVRHRLPFIVAAFALSVLSCGREVTGPENGIYRNRVAMLAFAPEFSGPMAVIEGAGDAVPFEKVRVVLRGLDGSIVKDTMVAFPSDADEISLALSIAIPQNSPAAGLPLTVTMAYVNAAGDTVFRGGPNPVVARPVGSPGADTPVTVPVTYDGAGKDATRVAISPKTGTVVAGQTLAFSATAFDAADAAIPNTPFVFSTLDPTRATVDPVTGVATWLPVRGVARVIAELPNGARADTASVTVGLPASKLVLGSGSAQTGAVNAMLADTIVVRTLASDDVPVEGVIVSFAVATGEGALSVLTDTSDANGDVKTAWTLGAALGTQSITATSAGLTGSPLTVTATAVAATPVRLEITQEPVGTTAGATLAPNLSVTARDAFGNVATTFTGDVTIGVVGVEPPTLGGTVTRAAVGGVVSFDDLSLQVAGTFQLVASGGSLLPDTTSEIAVAAGAAVRLEFVQQPQGAVAGDAFVPPVSVRAVDAFGNVSTDFTGDVSLALGGTGPAQLRGTVTRAAVAAVASFDDLNIREAGSGYVLVASGAGLLPDTSVGFAIDAGAAAQLLIIAGDAQSGIAGIALTDSLRVEARDLYNNPVANTTVNFAVVSGGGSVTAASVSTDASGRAATQWILGASVGAQQVDATLGAAPAVSVAFGATAIAGEPVEMVLLEQPDSALAGESFAPSIIIEVRDAFGNRATSWADSVRIVIDSGPDGGAVLHPVLGDRAERLINGGGVNFGVLGGYEIEQIGTYRLRVVSDGGLSVALAPLPVVTGPAAQFGILSGNNQTIAVSSPFPDTLRVYVRDAFGNPKVGHPTTWSENGVVTLGVTGVVLTDSNGVATNTAIAGTALGYQGAGPSVTTDGVGSVLTFEHTVTAAEPASVVAVSGDGQSGSVGTTIASPLIVEVRDAGNNLVPDAIVHWQVTGGDANVTIDTVLTDGTGRSQTEIVLGSVTGAVSVTATVDGLTPVQFTLTATAGEAIYPDVVVAPAGGTVGSALAPFSVAVYDQYGNVATGYSGTAVVTLDKATGAEPDPVILAGDTVAVVNGVATWDNLVIATAGTYRVIADFGSTLGGYSSPVLAFEAAAPAVLLNAGGSGQNAAVTEFTTNPMRARVTDAYGNAVSGVTVNFNIIDGLASLGAASVQTDLQGYAEVTVQMDTVAGPVLVGAFAEGLSPESLLYALTALPGTPNALLVIAGDAQTIAVGDTTDTLRVQLKDAYGNSIAGETVTWDSPSDVTFSSVSGVTDSAGFATTTVIAGGTIGLLDAYARFALPELSAYFTVTVQEGEAVSLEIVSAPDGGSAGNTLSSLIVQLRDAFGNVAKFSDATVEVAVDAALTPGTLGGTLSVLADSGIAVFSNLVLTQAGPYALVVNASGLTPDTTAQFTVVAGEADTVFISGGDGQVGIVGGTLANPLEITVLDVYGNPVVDFETYWNIVETGGIFSTVDTLIARTDSNGVAQMNLTFGPYPESFTVNASALDAGSVNFAMSSTNAAAALLEVAAEPDGAIAGDSVGPIVVVARDSLLNAALDFNGDITAVIDSGPAGATLGGTTTVTASAGTASFADLTLDRAGTYRLRFQAAGLADTVTGTFSVTAAEAAQIAIVEGDAQTDTVGSALATPLRVRVTDAFGNPVSGVNLDWMADDNVSFGEFPIGTDINGEMAIAATLGAVAGAIEVRVAIAALPDSSVTFTLTALAGTATQLVVTSAPDSVMSGDTIGVVVEARDDYGNVATSFSGDVTIERSDAVADPLGTLTVSAVDGVATFTEIYFGLQGNYTLRAQSDVDTVGFDIDVIAGPSALLTIESGDNQTEFAGMQLQVPIQLRVADAFGNPIEGDTVFVTRGIGTGLLGEQLESLAVATDSDGRVYVYWTLGSEEGTQTLEAGTATLGPITLTATALPAAWNVVWTGNASTSPTDPTNWSTGTPPTSTDAVLIPAGRPNYPALQSFTQWGRLTVEDGAQLNMGSAALYVNGSVRTPLSGVTRTSTNALTAIGAGTVVGGFPALRIEGTHSTAGLVRVEGNLTLAGTLEVSVGDSLHVTGGVESFSSGALQQPGASGIYIGGDFWSEGNSRLGAGGRLHIYGDIRTNQVAAPDAIVADSSHELYLLPGRTQDISLWAGDGNIDGPCTASCFGRIIALKEGTPYGVSFGGQWQTGPIRARGGVEFNVSNVISNNADLIVGAPSMLRTEEYAAFGRVTIDGELDAPRITADTLVALGTGLLPPQIEATIIVVGDRQVDAELYGPVLVDGSLDVVGPNAIAGYVRTRGNGYIRMTEPDDSLLVYGELRLEGTAAAGQLTAGFLDIQGILYIGSGPAVLAEANHITRIRGFDPSITVIDPPSSHLATLLVDGSNVVTLIADGLTLRGDLRLEGTEARLVEARPSVVTVGNSLLDPAGNLSVGTVIVDGENGVQTPSVSGNLIVRGLSALSGDLDVAAALTITDKGELTLGDHRVIVGGDFSTTVLGTLRMQSSGDTLRVLGDAIFGGGSTLGQLTAGVLELHGGLQQLRGEESFATFHSSAEHFVRFAGGTTNQIFFESSNDTDGSRIGNLSIAKQDGQVSLASGDLYVQNIVGSFTNAGFSVGTASQDANLYVLGSVSPTVSAENRGFFLDAFGRVQILRGEGLGCATGSIRVDGNTDNFSPQPCRQP